MNSKYPLAVSSWGEEEYGAIQKVVDSGNFTMGENVQEFERQFAIYIKSRFCVMVNSGSSANLLMIAALFYTKNEFLKLKPGDEVIVPAVSWSTTYYPLYQYGLKIKFVDIDLHTLNFDLEQLKDAITERTRLIFAVNLLGNPNDFGKINDLILDKYIVLIEDNCEAMGAKYNGKFTGTFGVMGSFSSFFSHHISTMEGGLIVTEDEELYHILLSLRAHGWTRNLPVSNRVCGDRSDDAFHESFRFVLPGYNVRPLEMSGAIGLHQLKRLPLLISERQKNAQLLQKTMVDHPSLIIQKEIGQSSWFGFSLIVRSDIGLSRNLLLKELGELGFECRPIVAGNFTKNEVVKYFNYETHGILHNANHIDEFGLFIGNQHFSLESAISSLTSVLA